MRAVLTGAGPLARMTAEILVRRGDDVVIIEKDREVIDELQDQLDCAFIHGDGARPQILKETGPSEDAVLFCLTDNDQSNILASLVGRSLGFGRVFTKVENSEFEHICAELSLEDTIVPDRYVAQILAGIAKGSSPLEFSSFFKLGVQAFSFVATKDEAGPIEELALPERSEVICIYRKEKALLGVGEPEIESGDEVVLIAHEDVMGELRERWGKSSKKEAGKKLSSTENGEDEQ